MHAGKLVFAQVMEFVAVAHVSALGGEVPGDFNVRTFSCLDQFLCMAFAQLTYRESLRDIEACLRSQSSQALPPGACAAPSAAARWPMPTKARDWRIYCDFAHALIRIARRLYAQRIPRGRPRGDRLRAGLHHHRSVPDVVSLGAVSPTKAAIKLHTLLDLRGAIPTLHPHQRRQAARRQRPRSAHPRARRLLRHGSRLSRLSAPVHAAPSGQLLRHSRHDPISSLQPAVLPARRPQHGTDLRSVIELDRLLFSARLSRAAAAHSLSRRRRHDLSSS